MTSFEWRAYPFVRLFVCLIVGMLAARWPLLLMALLLLPMASADWRDSMLVLTIVGFGFLQPLNRSAKPSSIAPDSTSFFATVLSLPAPTAKGLRCDVCLHLEQGEGLNARIYLDSSEIHAPGDVLKLSGELILCMDIPVSDDFDFGAFLSSQGIDAVMYYPKIVRTHATVETPRILLELFKGRLSKRLCQGFQNDMSTQVASALVLGDKRFLKKETKMSFANTGAIHVLAVSGLHMGLVAAALTFLTGRISKRFRWIRAGILVCGIWSFALITGLAPSCTRAALLFTALALGKCLNRKGKSFNLLAGAAFIQLIFRPEDLESIGFQLSYCAVAGILWFEPLLRRPFKMRWLNWVGSMLRISIAAQLGTLPLVLFYFERFPIWFWLSGFLVIPAASIILSLGLTKLILGKGIISTLASNALESVISLMVDGIEWLESLPAGVLTLKGFDAVQLMLTTGIVIVLGLFLKTPNHSQFRMTCWLVLVLTFYSRIL